MFAIVAVLLLLALPDCTSVPKSPSAASPSTARSEQASFVQTCSESVYGELPKDWERNTLVVGPIAFYDLRGEAAESPSVFAHHLGGWGATKTTAVVAEGKAVTVSVPSTERGHLAILYGLPFKDSGLYALSDGVQTVTFRACKPGQSPYKAFGAKGGTQFNGGFIVAGAHCASLDITPAGKPTQHLIIPFGAGTTCPSTGP